ncbi:MAG: methionyl-tRNA formyltransferase [Rickettsiales bacterium]|jgi:methionyl-tRNA formyltransferase|nr:methionyl-tRNA formyltransferase [Rickettsiales bacterium]
MRLILMGTPDFAVPVFDKIADAHQIAAVFTRGPKPAGRARSMTKTPVHGWADRRGFPVFNKINAASLPKADFIVVYAYGVILRDDVLAAAPCINIHPSLLPKYRGASPIISAIMNGDSESGVCLMKMAAEVDSGDILACEKFNIGENDTLAEAEARAGILAAEMALRYLAAPGDYRPVPQTGEPSFTKKITAGDEIIDWKKSPREIHNQIRAIGGRTVISGKDVKILSTKVEDGGLKILTIQPAGKKPMDWASFANGCHGKIQIGS